jgi:hypothetical protein
MEKCELVYIYIDKCRYETEEQKEIPVWYTRHVQAHFEHWLYEEFSSFFTFVWHTGVCFHKKMEYLPSDRGNNEENLNTTKRLRVNRSTASLYSNCTSWLVSSILESPVWLCWIYSSAGLLKSKGKREFTAQTDHLSKHVHIKQEDDMRNICLLTVFYKMFKGTWNGDNNPCLLVG